MCWFSNPVVLGVPKSYGWYLSFIQEAFNQKFLAIRSGVQSRGPMMCWFSNLMVLGVLKSYGWCLSFIQEAFIKELCGVPRSGAHLAISLITSVSPKLSCCISKINERDPVHFSYSGIYVRLRYKSQK